jgi:glycosyltransferase involved in cell wall biosynthesis
MENCTMISVLMSVYNTDFYIIKRAIDSVLSQSYQNFELIIIDDGSHYEFNNQLLKYVIKHENKITYLRHSNCGQSESINRGISNSIGAYITIIDADDEYKVNHLWACMQEIEDYDLIASTTETIADFEDDFYVPDKNDFNQLIHVDNCILFATLFGKKNVFINLKFQKGYAADSLFFEMASLEYQTKKVDLRTYIYYRNSENSICSRMKNNLSNN